MDADAYVDVLPWLLFAVVDRKTGLGISWAGGCAAAAAAGFAVWSRVAGRKAITPWVGIVVFGGFFLLGEIAPDAARGFHGARAVACFVLGVTAVASLRWTPLSMSYTTTRVVPSIRSDPRFARVNRVITLGWAMAAFLAAGAYTLPQVFGSSVAFTFADWVAPLVLAAATVKWSAVRWERFRMQMYTEPMFQPETPSLVPVRLVPDQGRWASVDDASVHSLDDRRRRNA